MSSNTEESPTPTFRICTSFEGQCRQERRPETQVNGTYDYKPAVHIKTGSRLDYLVTNFDPMVRPLKNFQKIKRIYTVIVEQRNKVNPIVTKITSDFNDTYLKPELKQMLLSAIV